MRRAAAAVRHGLSGSRIDLAPFERAAGIDRLTTSAELLVFRRSDALAERETDVVIVGSGAAAWAAACGATSVGGTALILERLSFYGGTSRHSGGVLMIFNNAVMQERGDEDPREDAIRYMAETGFPKSYDPALPALGLPEIAHRRIASYYDHGASVIDEMERLGIFRLRWPWLDWTGAPFPDYVVTPEDRAPRGRGLKVVSEAGAEGMGRHLIAGMREFALDHGTQFLPRHRVVDVERTVDGAVSGVIAERGDGALARFAARAGVVFASGGFGHNPTLRSSYLGSGAAAGGCSVSGNTGDFLSIAASVGAQPGPMTTAWWTQMVLEHADDRHNGNLDCDVIPGDSVILVNCNGTRVVNEKLPYHQRAIRAHQVGHGLGPANNTVLMVYDQRTADLSGGQYPLPPPGGNARHVITGTSIQELVTKVDDRLRELAKQPCSDVSLGGAGLAADTARTLEQTIMRFNEFALTGIDADFARGERAVELAFHGPRQPGNNLPNPTMFPLLPTGPYYAIMIVGAVKDSNGGPQTTDDGQLVDDATGQPIHGLYGAGNCVASLFGSGYPAGGATLGPAVVFGFRAGRHAICTQRNTEESPRGA